MSLGIAVLISFTSFFTLWISLPPGIKRFIVRHKAPFNFILHGTVIWMFLGTFSGLMQAEATAVLFTLCLEAASFVQTNKQPKQKAEDRLSRFIREEEQKARSTQP